MYQTRRILREQGEKIEGPEKTAVESAVADLEEALKGSDNEAIKSATERLMTASQTFSQRLYEQAAAESNQGQAGGSGAGATGADDDEVVDAEIVDEDRR